jgi:hypothetical protein
MIRDHRARRDWLRALAEDSSVRSFLSYLPVILLALAIVVGIPIAYRSWREAHEEDDPVTDDDVLAGIEEAYAAGELDEAEFRRARALILGIETKDTRVPRPSPTSDAGAPEDPSNTEPS